MGEEKRRTEAAYHRFGGVIRDIVYAAHDGIITTFAVIASATGAGLSPAVIVILGFANLVADGLSMGLGNFLGIKSERSFVKRMRREAQHEIDEHPERETDELKKIYAKKGFEGEVLEKIVAVLTEDKERWIQTMMQEELELPNEEELKPGRNGTVTFFSFIVAGFVPLATYLVPGLGANVFPVAIAVTGLILFIIGSTRVLVTGGNFFLDGLEMLLVGAIAAGAAYTIGVVLSRVLGVL